MMRKSQVVIDFDKLAPFRPPALVTLYIVLLKTVQLTGLLTSLLLVLRHFRLTGTMEIGWLILVIFLTHLLSFYRRLWSEEHFVPDSFFARLGEFAVMIIGLRLVLLAFGQASPVVTLDFIYYSLFMSAAWYAGMSFLHQYFNLYLQPYEVGPEEGGVPALGDAYHLSYDHTQAYQELKTNFRYMAMFQVIIVLAGVSLANQFEQYPGKAELSMNLVLLGGMYLLLGMPLLVWARMRYLRTLWQLDKLKEPGYLASRWVYYLGGMLLVGLVIALAVSSLGGVATLPLPTGGDNSNPLSTIVNPPSPQPVPTMAPIVPPERPDNSPRMDLSWLGTIIQVVTVLIAGALFLAVLFYAFTRLIQVGWVGPQWRKLAASELWRNFRKFWRNLLQPKRPKDPFEKDGAAREGRFDPFGWLKRDQLPDDPRGRVRFYYRQVAHRAGRAGLPRRAGQTPAEYARYLTPNLEEAQDQANLENLTGLYQEARFSAHQVAQSQAETARESSQGLVAFFRLRSRRARIKPRD
jgi:uncharacterized membrane protein YidH (DUF202 family)